MLKGWVREHGRIVTVFRERGIGQRHGGGGAIAREALAGSKIEHEREGKQRSNELAL